LAMFILFFACYGVMKMFAGLVQTPEQPDIIHFLIGYNMGMITLWVFRRI